MAKISDKELVDKLFILNEAYSGIKFFKYQEQFSKRIIRSVLLNDGDELTSLQARQTGKSETVATTVGGLSSFLPVLANMPLFAGDKRLEPFKNGLLVGIFAPALQQSQIIFNRMKQRMGSKEAIRMYEDPSINLQFETNNGQNIGLSNGSVVTTMSASPGSNIEGRSYHLIIVDEAQDVGGFKYSKSISPMGAFYNATKVLIGTPSVVKGFFYYSIERNKRDYENGEKPKNHYEYNWEYVARYNKKYLKYVEGEKARLGEESDEFQMSYNLKWILERGMFTTTTQFARNGDVERGIVHQDLNKKHVVGIDVGKSADSTVLTFLEVDYENPVIVERAKELETPDYIAYRKHIKKWVEIQGDDWEQQYYMIMDELKLFNVVRLVIDATAVGGPLASRLDASLPYEVIPYVFSGPSKSDLYKHYDTELRSVRLTYPANKDAQDTREFAKFEQQHLELNKEYSGQQMRVYHPPVKGAHDDYPDSSALAVWGAQGGEVEKPEIEDRNHFLDSGGFTGTGFYSSMARVTARRR